MTGGTPAVVSLTGLTPSTAYKYYFVAKDSANNDQAAISAGLAITTIEAQVPPLMGDVPNQAGTAGVAFILATAGYVSATNGDSITGYRIASGSLPPGVSLNTGNGVFSGTPTTAGTYNITLQAQDKDGWSNADSIQFVIAAGADTTPPATPATLTLTGNGGASAGYTNTQAITLNVADVADPSGVYWFVSESSSAPAAGAGGWSSTKPTSYSLSGGNGTKNVYVYVRDNAATPNVQATGKTTAIVFDATLPTAVPAALPASLASGATLAGQSVTFADNLGGTPKALSITANNGVSITGGPFTTYGANTYNIVAPANNTVAAITATVTYSVTDNAGNVATATQTIDIAPAPVNAAPTITNLPNWGAGVNIPTSTPQTVTFSDDKVWGGASSITVSVDKGDFDATGNSISFNSYGAKNFIYNSPAGGVFPGDFATITYTVRDSDGVTTTTTQTIPLLP